MKDACKIAIFALAAAAASGAPETFLISADVDGGVITSSAVISTVIGADMFYNYGIYGASTRVAVMEAGKILQQHTVFDNSNIGEEYLPDGLSTDYISNHKTACAGVICGVGPQAPSGGYYTMCLGIAPLAQLASGLTGDDSSITADWYYGAYKHFFEDSPADVISTSESPVLPIAQATPLYFSMIDSLAYKNSLTTFVCAAGNDGPEADTVCHLGHNFNGITVGALGNHHKFDTVAAFSSRGASAFCNPITGEIIEAARATVDITAPGENIVVASFDSENPSTEMFSVSSGTSFAAPITAGVAALMASASKVLEENSGWTSAARDSRVIKAVMLNSADKPDDWDNGQAINEAGFIETTQALDYAYGAGILNASAALEQYAMQNEKRAWLLASLYKNSSVTYSLGELEAGEILAATLVWDAQGDVSESSGGESEGSDIMLDFTAFADLNLELLCDDGAGLDTIALSDSPYNSVEHLYLQLAQSGEYYLRVIFDELVYGETDSEIYALAWNIVPEPAAAALLAALVCMLAARRRR